MWACFPRNFAHFLRVSVVPRVRCRVGEWGVARANVDVASEQSWPYFSCWSCILLQNQIFATKGVVTNCSLKRRRHFRSQFITFEFITRTIIFRLYLVLTDTRMRHLMPSILSWPIVCRAAHSFIHVPVRVLMQVSELPNDVVDYM